MEVLFLSTKLNYNNLIFDKDFKSFDEDSELYNFLSLKDKKDLFISMNGENLNFGLCSVKLKVDEIKPITLNWKNINTIVVKDYPLLDIKYSLWHINKTTFKNNLLIQFDLYLNPLATFGIKEIDINVGDGSNIPFIRTNINYRSQFSDIQKFKLRSNSILRIEQPEPNKIPILKQYENMFYYDSFFNFQDNNKLQEKIETAYKGKVNFIIAEFEAEKFRDIVNVDELKNPGYQSIELYPSNNKELENYNKNIPKTTNQKKYKNFSDPFVMNNPGILKRTITTFIISTTNYNDDVIYIDSLDGGQYKISTKTFLNNFQDDPFILKLVMVDFPPFLLEVLDPSPETEDKNSIVVDRFITDTSGQNIAPSPYKISIQNQGLIFKVSKDQIKNFFDFSFTEMWASKSPLYQYLFKPNQNLEINFIKTFFIGLLSEHPEGGAPFKFNDLYNLPQEDKEFFIRFYVPSAGDVSYFDRLYEKMNYDPDNPDFNNIGASVNKVSRSLNIDLLSNAFKESRQNPQKVALNNITAPLGGAIKGAESGAVGGSFVPGVGNAVGAVIGGAQGFVKGLFAPVKDRYIKKHEPDTLKSTAIDLYAEMQAGLNTKVLNVRTYTEKDYYDIAYDYHINGLILNGTYINIKSHMKLFPKDRFNTFQLDINENSQHTILNKDLHPEIKILLLNQLKTKITYWNTKEEYKEAMFKYEYSNPDNPYY